MLRRKLFRTMKLYRAQFLSMVIMIAIGIAIFVGFNVEWYSLERDTLSFLEETGFADYRIVSEKGFSQEDADAIAAISGIDTVSRHLTAGTTRDEDGDTIAVNVTTNPAVSGFLVTSGASYDATSKDGIWLSDQYAAANEIRVGDTLSLVYKNFHLSGTVKGLIKSGEYLICVADETQVMPDYSGYGYAYLSPAMLRKLLLGMEFYPQINVRTSLDKETFTRAVDEALGETMLIVPKEDTISYSEAMGESNEGKTMGSVLPVLFLAIAVLTMVTTMHRLTASEKTQIGSFKALGYRDGKILRHYASYALAVGLAGTLLGTALGWLIGWFIMNPGGPMGTYLDMPDWSLSAPFYVWIVLIAINVFLLLIGILSVRSFLHCSAAEALRPYTPKKMRSLLLEKTFVWKHFSFGTKWNLRDSLRHKARSAMTVFGIFGCTLLLVGSLGMRDTMDMFVDQYYGESILYETKINLDTETVDNSAALELADAYSADLLSQTSVQIGGKAVGLEIYHTGHDMVRFLADDPSLGTGPDGSGSGHYLHPGPEGVLVCRRIAREFHLQPGDEITFSPYGSSETYTAAVTGIIRSLTESIIMSDTYAQQLGLTFTFSSIYTSETQIAADKAILNTQSRQMIIASLDTIMQIMDEMIWLLVAAAIILGIVVLYNLGFMSYVERYREMATLKVIGFKDRKIRSLLISQNIWMTVLGVLAGIPAGRATLQVLMELLAGEYEMNMTIRPSSYLISILLTFGVSLLVGLIIARKNRHIDMVEALKGQE